MKTLLVAIIMLIFPALSHAYCADSYMGANERKVVVEIHDEGCATNVNFISFWSDNKDGTLNRDSFKSFPFKSECDVTNTGFTCREDGHTPLAGATFEIQHDGKDSCDGTTPADRYKCVKGCDKPTVPKYLNFTASEC